MRTTSIVHLLIPTLLAQVIPLPTRSLSVKWIDMELTDAKRLDPFNATHVRRMMVSHFTPVLECRTTCEVPYMPAELARIEDEILADYLGDIGWSKGVLANLKIETCCEVDGLASALTKKFPTILLGSGLNTTRLFYAATAQHLASAGYEVILMDHPYETDVVVFPDGEIVFGGRIASDPNNTTALEFGLDVRSQDVSFILDTFNISKTVYIGHSYGGASAAAALINETRIVGGVNLDGALWGPVQDEGVPRPFLTFGSAGHNSSDEDSWARLFNATKANYPDTWITELSLRGSVHGSFCDFPLIGNATGLNQNPGLVEVLFGEIQTGRLMNILVEYLDDFIHFSRGCGSEGLLAGENPNYPEVSFIQKSL